LTKNQYITTKESAFSKLASLYHYLVKNSRKSSLFLNKNNNQRGEKYVNKIICTKEPTYTIAGSLVGKSRARSSCSAFLSVLGGESEFAFIREHRLGNTAV
jgi:hypothetical protein